MTERKAKKDRKLGWKNDKMGKNMFGGQERDDPEMIV